MPRRQQNLNQAAQENNTGAGAAGAEAQAGSAQLSYKELWDARFLAAATVHHFEEQDLQQPIALGLSLHSLRRQQGGAFVQHTQLESDTELSEITDEECEVSQQARDQQPTTSCTFNPTSWQQAAWRGTRACLGMQLVSTSQAELKGEAAADTQVEGAQAAGGAAAAPSASGSSQLGASADSHGSQYSNTDKSWMRVHVDRPRRWTAMTVRQLEELGFRYQQQETRAYVRQGVPYAYKVVRCTQSSSNQPGVPACSVKLHLLQIPSDPDMLLIRQEGVHTHPPHKDVQVAQWQATARQLQGGTPLGLQQVLMGAIPTPAPSAHQHPPIPCPTAAPYSLAPTQPGTLLGALQPLGLLSSQGRVDLWQHSMHSAPATLKDEQLCRVVGALMTQLGLEHVDVEKVMEALQQMQSSRAGYTLPSYERVAAAMLHNLDKQQQHMLASCVLAAPPGPDGSHSSLKEAGSKPIKALPAAQLESAVARWLEAEAYSQQHSQGAGNVAANPMASNQTGGAGAQPTSHSRRAPGGAVDELHTSQQGNQSGAMGQVQLGAMGQVQLGAMGQVQSGTMGQVQSGTMGQVQSGAMGQVAEQAAGMVGMDSGTGDGVVVAGGEAAGLSQRHMAKRRKQVHWASDVAGVTGDEVPPLQDGADSDQAAHRAAGAGQETGCSIHSAGRAGSASILQAHAADVQADGVVRQDGQLEAPEHMEQVQAGNEHGMEGMSCGSEGIAHGVEGASGPAEVTQHVASQQRQGTLSTRTRAEAAEAATHIALWIADLLARKPVFGEPTKTAAPQQQQQQRSINEDEDVVPDQEGFPVTVRPVKKYGRKWLTKIWSQDKELRDALVAARHPLAPETRGGRRKHRQQTAGAGQQQDTDSDGDREDAGQEPNQGRSIKHPQQLHAGAGPVRPVGQGSAGPGVGHVWQGSAGGSQGPVSRQLVSSEAWRLSPAFLLDAGLLGGDLNTPWRVNTGLLTEVLHQPEDDTVLPGQLQAPMPAGDLDPSSVPVGTWTQLRIPSQAPRTSALERHLSRAHPIMVKAVSALASQAGPSVPPHDQAGQQQGVTRPKACKRPLPAWTASVLGASDATQLQSASASQAYWSAQMSGPQLQPCIPSTAAVEGSMTATAGVLQGHLAAGVRAGPNTGRGRGRGRGRGQGSMPKNGTTPSRNMQPSVIDVLHASTLGGVSREDVGSELGSGQAQQVWVQVRQTRTGQQADSAAQQDSGGAVAQPAPARLSGDRQPAGLAVADGSPSGQPSSGQQVDITDSNGPSRSRQIADAPRASGYQRNGQDPVSSETMPAGLQLISVLATRLGVKPAVAARAANRYMAIMQAAQQAGETDAAQRLASMGGAGDQRTRQRARLTVTSHRQVLPARLPHQDGSEPGHAPSRVQRTRRAAAGRKANKLTRTSMKHPGAVAWMQLLQRFADLSKEQLTSLTAGAGSSSDAD